MKNKLFEAGDWCFCEFSLQQIKEIKNGVVTSVSDGRFNLSGNNLSDRCYPLTARIKNISDTVQYYSKEFHSLNHNSLNYPDLNRELIKRWCEMCEENDDSKLQKLYDSLDKFSREVINRVNDLKYEAVQGVNLFRK